jgi:hypothetical protein
MHLFQISSASKLLVCFNSFFFYQEITEKLPRLEMDETLILLGPGFTEPTENRQINLAMCFIVISALISLISKANIAKCTVRSRVILIDMHAIYEFHHI